MRKGYHYRRLYNTNLNSPWLLVILLLLLIIGYFSSNISLEAILFFVVPISFAILISGGLLIWYINRVQENRRKALRIIDIDAMSGIQFERYVGELLKFQGYSVSFTKQSGDFGADIIARKNGEMYIVQLKRYAHAVGIEAVQQAISAMAYYFATKSMVVTNNYFTSAAQELAKANNCELVNRDQLSDWILAFQKG